MALFKGHIRNYTGIKKFLNVKLQVNWNCEFTITFYEKTIDLKSGSGAIVSIADIRNVCKQVLKIQEG